MNVVKLRDELGLLRELTADTVRLISATNVIPAIKRLLRLYDILALNVDVAERFRSQHGLMPVDRAAFQDLITLRRELMVYHRGDFHPAAQLINYCAKLTTLLTLLQKELIGIT
jgi:hypothetical protein